MIGESVGGHVSGWCLVWREEGGENVSVKELKGGQGGEQIPERSAATEEWEPHCQASRHLL